MGAMEQFPVTATLMGPRDWPWLKEKAKVVLCGDTRGVVIKRGDEIVAAAAFDNWTETSCIGHLAIDDPRVARRLYRAAFDLVFNFSGRKILLGVTPGNNERALRLHKGMGFQEVYRVKEGFAPGVDYVLLEMRVENCKLLSKPYLKAA